MAATAAVGTHPTGMPSCRLRVLILVLLYDASQQSSLCAVDINMILTTIIMMIVDLNLSVRLYRDNTGRKDACAQSASHT